ncbi:N-acylneuraminate-9-phosphate synthase [Helicobacter sp. 16-1353]|uniref:N-acetylneuraminate synthase family protein n=1 Tax=Helicobacter sp. 16-1353 TaxID=2004996 RepID=UPI000DCC66A8|nr:N-acetylneuraminate synthase family protein [Helicobacter sp. 16-1353]RAX51901.1 N-acylneuraminate-9-phosphate synthase [Helicobacter sp. 16-1353]
MAEVMLDNNILIGDYAKPYIVAEINSSHNGSVDKAKEMIDKAKEINISCVKFQSWSANSLYSNDYYDKNPIQKRIVDKFALRENELLQLAKYAKSIGIDFSSTPYSNDEVDFLVDECKVPYIKVASQDINTLPFLEYIATKNKPIVLSTGMSSIEEIKQAVNLIESTRNYKIIILHCVSIYPTKIENVNLNNIVGLRELFPKYPIGFSDHTIGVDIAIASVALGCGLIEKHFTLDNKKMGMDNNMATEPKDFLRLINGCNEVYQAMGDKHRIITKEEYASRLKMRRSIVAKRDLKRGEILSLCDLDFKRPAEGISPDKIDEIVGFRIKSNIKAGYLINKKDIDIDKHI